jgi:hypothetical protein
MFRRPAGFERRERSDSALVARNGKGEIFVIYPPDLMNVNDAGRPG